MNTRSRLNSCMHLFVIFNISAQETAHMRLTVYIMFPGQGCVLHLSQKGQGLEVEALSYRIIRVISPAEVGEEELSA